MHRVSRSHTLWTAAIATTLIGSALVYFGVGSRRYADIGWFEYISEMIALVGSVPVEPAGTAGLILAGSAVLAAAFLIGLRWSAPRRNPRVGDRSRTLTFVWWGTAALTAIGLLIVYIGASAPQPAFSYGSVDGLASERPSLIEDPTLLFGPIYVAPATFIGAGLVWAGLLVTSFLLGRYGVTWPAPFTPLTAALRRPVAWWSAAALTAVGLAVVVITRLTTPSPMTYDALSDFVAFASPSVFSVVEDPGLDGAVVVVYVGTILALAGLLVMSLVVDRSPASRRARITAPAGG